MATRPSARPDWPRPARERRSTRADSAGACPLSAVAVPSQAFRRIAALRENRTNRDTNRMRSFLARCTPGPAAARRPPAIASCPGRKIRTCPRAHSIPSAPLPTQWFRRRRGLRGGKDKTRPRNRRAREHPESPRCSRAARTKPDARTPRSTRFRAHRAGASAEWD